jgi:hypothetical protein
LAGRAPCRRDSDLSRGRRFAWYCRQSGYICVRPCLCFVANLATYLRASAGMNSGLSGILFQPVLRFREQYWTGRENDGQSAAPGTKALDGPVEARRDTLGPREPAFLASAALSSFNFPQQSHHLFQPDRPVGFYGGRMGRCPLDSGSERQGTVVDRRLGEGLPAVQEIRSSSRQALPREVAGSASHLPAVAKVRRGRRSRAAGGCGALLRRNTQRAVWLITGIGDAKPGIDNFPVLAGRSQVGRSTCSAPWSQFCLSVHNGHGDP